MSLPPLKFHDGKFTVLHVTDIQDMHYLNGLERNLLPSRA